MTETLHDILRSDDPGVLPRIEKALSACDDLDRDLEAVLSALILHRRASGEAGLLGAVLYRDCAQRLPVLPAHLRAIGATDAANAVSDLRRDIPLEDAVISCGLIDWLDTQPDLARSARRRTPDLDGLDDDIRRFLRRKGRALPDLPLPPEHRTLFGRMVQSMRRG